ncbi:MAG: hemerythrin domain-containing protein [Acidobacteria bacterium]|nr:hemerythrin domain-containing protein [Acidobacteriota bacterium]
MSRIHPVQVLLDEHEVIEGVINTMEWALARLENDPASLPVLNKTLDFLGYFADGLHHEKEEKVLFPVLKRKGLSGAARSFVSEHRTGHMHLAAIEENLPAALQGESRARSFIYSEGLVYAALMREHIREENETVLELARQILSPEDIAELDRLSATLDDENYEKYIALGEELAGAAAALGAR